MEQKQTYIPDFNSELRDFYDDLEELSMNVDKNIQRFLKLFVIGLRL